MKSNKFLFQLLALFSIVFVMQSCVEDDDFDAPEIPQYVLGADACYTEDFQSYADGAGTIPGSQIVTTDGTKSWQVDIFQGEGHLKMGSFGTGEVQTTWFIQGVNFDVVNRMSFETLSGYHNGDVLSVWTSTNYDPESGDPAAASWTEITDGFEISKSVGGFANGWTESGIYTFDSSLSGNGFVAFLYKGDDANNAATTTMELDDIQYGASGSGDCTYALSEVEATFISVGGGSASAASCLTEDFEGLAEEQTEFAAYVNISNDTGRYWEVDEFNDNKYLKLSAFAGSGNPVAVFKSYFVVPVNFDEAETFRFKTQDRYYNGNPLKVYTSTDYTVGGNIADATLTDITSNFTLASGTTGGASQPFVASGDYSLASLSGNGFVIFEYVGDGSISSTMHIDDIEVIDADDTDCGGGTSADACATQDFESFANEQNDLDGYQHIATTGDLDWTVREHSDNKYIQMSAFSGNGGNGDHVAWFVMGVNFDTATGISFDSKDGFNNGDPMTVWYSTDYDEQGDPSTANWTNITSEFTIATGTSSGFASEFTPSGTYNFSGLSGNGYITFRYEGNSDGVTTTIQVDNINVYGDGTCTFDLAAIDNGGNTGAETILISELSDPDNNSNARFVEIWNYGSEPVNLSGWSLQRWTNDNTEVSASSKIDLVGTIAAGDAFVVAKDETEFNTAYGFAPDQVSSNSSADSNGDDQIGLFKPDGSLHDIFGVPGEDGSGTNHEFEDGRARRKATVMMPNTTYNFDEWDVWNDTGDAGTTNEPQMAPDDFTPGTHPDTTTGGGDNTGLIITEYAEGSSNNKYIEIYNPTSGTIDLSAYGLNRAANGGDWDTDGATEHYFLTGTIAAGATHVYAHAGADDAAITGYTGDITMIDTSTDPNPMFFNGDDAIGLFYNDNGTYVLVDAVGEPSNDPGTAWNVAGVENATKDHTLTRKTAVTAGNTNWAASAGSTADDSEWIVLDQNDFSSIGVR